MADKVIKPETLQQSARMRRKRRHRIQLGIFLSVVVLITLLLLYMFTNISYIKSIDISGTHLVSEKKVREVMNVGSKDRIYAISPRKIEQNIKLQDGVKDVTVRRHFPNKVTVAIDEYQVRAMVADGSSFHPVLENGQQLKSYSTPSTYNVPIAKDFGRAEMKQLVDVLNHTKPAVRNSISEINFVPNQEASSRVQFFMNDGLEVIGDLRTIDDKLNYYPSMASEVPRDAEGRLVKAGIIDLEVGSVFIPYESKKAEERRLEMESEIAAKKEKENKKLESSVQDLKKQLEEVKRTNDANSEN